MTLIRFAAILGLVGALGACSRDTILEGDRIDIRAPWGGGTEVANRAQPIALPAQVANADWSHRQGNNGTRPQHPALSASPQLAWSTDIGQGDARRLRLATEPVAADGRIFTLDADARLQATGANGQVLWSRDVTPDWARQGSASGGGLAVAGNRLYVASAYGFLGAFDANTGAEIWRERFDSPLMGAPMVSGDRVFVSAGDSTLWSLDAATGRIDWTLAGTESISIMSRTAAPAAAGDLVVFPTQSGELRAVRRANGASAWAAVLAGRRVGAAYANISSVTGDPVADGNRIYAANQSGRLMAVDARNGETLWSVREAAYSPVWPVGGSVFLVSDENRVMRLDAATGEPVWAQELPLFTDARPRRQAEIYPQYGPLLAGGRLWVASGDGALRGFDPVSGAIGAQITVPGGAASGPIVMNRTLYVLSRDGVLHAYR
ncbi:outer membrane protein assembly factor BamB family protein [Pararhodobacter sp.]|uniref:outer membrane protein assembly factor BamB family protein n=1 Tax=Pararhodobacter sp. TaxID=2127056 RepID=UPI002FDEF15E